MPMWFEKFRSSSLAIVLAALVIALGGFFFGQKMGDFGRLGDEYIYTIITVNFDRVVFEQGLDDYRIKRILPCGLVHYTLKAFSQPLEVDNIITVFGIYNILLSVLIAWGWCRIANELQISVRGRWLGFLFIFCNYQMFKYIPFAQVSTDLFAYCTAIWLIYFFLRNNIIGLVVLSLIGAFIWPTLQYTGALFLLFPRDKENNAAEAKAPWTVNWLIAAAFVIFILTKIPWVLQGLHSGKLYEFGKFAMGSNKPLLPVIHLSITFMLAYVFFGWGMLLNSSKFFQKSYWLRTLRIHRIVIAVAMIVGLKLIVHYGSVSHDARPMNFLMADLIIVSTMQPAAFYVSHVMYFGPIIILGLFLWKPFCRYVQQHGLGLVLCLLAFVLFSLDSESRRQMNTFPLIVPFLVKVTDSMKWEDGMYWFLAVLSFLLSKVWMQIHPGPWKGSAMEFPAQSYYMSMGAWMSHPMYYLQGAFVLLAMVLVYFLLIHKQNINFSISKSNA